MAKSDGLAGVYASLSSWPRTVADRPSSQNDLRLYWIHYSSVPIHLKEPWTRNHHTYQALLRSHCEGRTRRRLLLVYVTLFKPNLIRYHFGATVYLSCPFFSVTQLPRVLADALTGTDRWKGTSSPLLSFPTSPNLLQDNCRNPARRNKAERAYMSNVQCFDLHFQLQGERSSSRSRGDLSRGPPAFFGLSLESWARNKNALGKLGENTVFSASTSRRRVVRKPLTPSTSVSSPRDSSAARSGLVLPPILSIDNNPPRVERKPQV